MKREFLELFLSLVFDLFGVYLACDKVLGGVDGEEIACT